MTARIDEAAHLIRRFFGHLTAKPLGPSEQQFVHEHLKGSCAEIYWSQADPDQRHALTVARRVEAALPNDREAVQAALLHDIGKSVASIGAVSRSLATVLDILDLPMPKRMREYRNHGAIGAEMIERLGCGALAVAFARHHPSPAPDGVDPRRWQTLIDADG